RKHPHQLESYSKLTQSHNSSQKRKCHENPPASTSKQLKLDMSSKRVSQVNINKAVIKFVVEGLQPFSVVDLQAFKDLIQDLQPNATIMSRPTLRSSIAEATKSMKKKLIAAMSEVEYIATTTDCWTTRRRSFIGITAHWLGPDSLDRHSVALACRQLKGSHTFDVLAAALNDIHAEYQIRDKIVRKTTDNGSNFLKAFRIYGIKREGDEEEIQEDDEVVNFQEVASVLDVGDGFEYHLPKHQRCACHLLNLVSTVDALKANSNEAYKKVSRATFSKCHALWNKSGRSALAAETIKDACKLQLIRPNATRWNSMFLAVERIVRIVKEQGEGAIRDVCTSFKIPMLNPTELAFLTEYSAIMSPMAKAIDILQAETNIQMGWLLPTLTQLKTKLDRIKPSLKFSKPLVDAIQLGLKNRFSENFEDPELIAAAILLPKFKTLCTKDETVLKKGHVWDIYCFSGLDYINLEMETLHPLSTLHATSSDDDDFFSSIKSNAQESSKELEGYLACCADHTSMLKTFPSICKLYIRLNTPLPASAACERLFSTAGLLFSPRRARMDSSNFENQLLLKLNKSFYNFE
ncbi:hypothetical protein PO909_029347, partial [Leuciscus waleckii]